MFLCVLAGYALAQYQNSRRSRNEICYSQVTDTSSLPNMLADKAEAVIRAGGQAGVRKIGQLVELVVQSATGDTELFRQVMTNVKDAEEAFGKKGQAGTEPLRTRPTSVEFYDPATGKWSPLAQ